MREKLTYQVSISERDYMGEVQMLKPIGEELKITQGQIDDNELVPTKASELTLTLLCTEEGDPLAELFTVDPTQYLVDVGVCRTKADGADVCMTLWSGYTPCVQWRKHRLRCGCGSGQYFAGGSKRWPRIFKYGGFAPCNSPLDR